MLAQLLLLTMAWQGPAPVKWSLVAPEGAVARGSKTTVTLQAEIAPGWHLYSLKKLEDGPIPTTITVAEGPALRLAGKIGAPPANVKYEEAFGLEVESYEGTAEFRLPIEATKAGEAVLKVEVRYQVCDNSQCLPPRTVPLELKLKVE